MVTNKTILYIQQIYLYFCLFIQSIFVNTILLTKILLNCIQLRFSNKKKYSIQFSFTITLYINLNKITTNCRNTKIDLIQYRYYLVQHYSTQYYVIDSNSFDQYIQINKVPAFIQKLSVLLFIILTSYKFKTKQETYLLVNQNI